jgi:hypothetical protein
MWQNSLHPGFVEGQELILRHLACRHRKLAVTALAAPGLVSADCCEAIVKGYAGKAGFMQSQVNK